MTRNSWAESGFREVSPGCGSVKPGISASLLSVPSSRKLLLRSRDPFTGRPCKMELDRVPSTRKDQQGNYPNGWFPSSLVEGNDGFLYRE